MIECDLVWQYLVAANFRLLRVQPPFSSMLNNITMLQQIVSDNKANQSTTDTFNSVLGCSHILAACFPFTLVRGSTVVLRHHWSLVSSACVLSPARVRQLPLSDIAAICQ